jgi:NodT family efflux transporter outer membrane factor (OMF) lipoprotein
MTARTIIRRLLAGAFAVTIGGCAVGPDFKRPSAPEVSAYTASPVSSTAATPNVQGGEAQHLLAGADIPGDWWTLFHSPALSALVEQALANNNDLKAAQAALTVARENVLAQRGAYYPAVSASLAANRAKTSAQLSPTPSSGALYYSLYTSQVSVSYAPDVFGLNRRTVEMLQAQEHQAGFELDAAHITLSANVVSAAIQEASLRAQLQATRALIDINSQTLDVLQQQFAHGYASRLDVAAQEAQLAQVTATLPPLVKQLAQERDLLAVLAGVFPSDGPKDEFELAQLQLPSDLPVSLPSKLVGQRPDVRQAEENLHAACAAIGVAVANRLPNITLSADLGSSALSLGQLFSGSTGFWDVSASVSQPIFEGGTLLHKERAARATYEQAAQSYRSTVLTAFQNVADTLAALVQDAEALKAASAAEQSAAVTLELTRKQQQGGYANNLALLSAEQAYQQSLLALVQAQANRYADTAALFLALGGGWWNRPELTKG